MERDGSDVLVFGRGVGCELEVRELRDRVARRAWEGEEAEAGGEEDDCSRVFFAEEAEEVGGHKFRTADVDFLSGQSTLARGLAKDFRELGNPQSPPTTSPRPHHAGRDPRCRLGPHCSPGHRQCRT
jgi:hypothetical protein